MKALYVIALIISISLSVFCMNSTLNGIREIESLDGELLTTERELSKAKTTIMVYEKELETYRDIKTFNSSLKIASTAINMMPVIACKKALKYKSKK